MVRSIGNCCKRSIHKTRARNNLEGTLTTNAFVAKCLARRTLVANKLVWNTFVAKVLARNTVTRYKQHLEEALETLPIFSRATNTAPHGRFIINSNVRLQLLETAAEYTYCTIIEYIPMDCEILKINNLVQFISTCKVYYDIK